MARNSRASPLVLLASLALCIVHTADAQVAAPAPSPNLNPAVQLTTNLSSFGNGVNVLVSWTGVQNPGPADAIGLIMPPGVPLNTVAVPLKYRFCAQAAPSYLTTGNGTATFRLLNQRQDVQFYLFSNITAAGNFTDGAVIAKSPVLTLTNPNEPTGGHLAYTNISGQISVQWNSRDAGTPTVQYGTTPALGQSATGKTSSYGISDMCGAPANTHGWINSGTQNNVILSNLPPNTLFYYRFGSPGKNFSFSANQTFTTPPPVGPTSTVYVLDTADMGHAEVDGSNEWEDDRPQRLYYAPGSIGGIESSIVNMYGQNGLEQGVSVDINAQLIKELTHNPPPSLLWMNGDICYARGFETQWDVMQDEYSTVSMQVPTMTTETDWPGLRPAGASDRFKNTATDSGGECGIPTYSRFQMPTSTFLGYWYSFNLGPIHNIAISSELDFTAGSPQFDFVFADLKAVNRSVTPWVIVHFHRPAYTSTLGSGDVQEASDLRSAYEDVFVEYQVDMVLSGHVHAYQRTCPVYKSTCIPAAADGSQRAPIYITNGNAGQWLTYTLQPKLQPFMMATSLAHGYLRYTVNQTTLVAQMVSETGKIFDTFQLTKPVGWTNNVTNQTTFATNLQSTYVPSAAELYGYTGSTEAVAAILAVVAANPSNYTSLQNATLVQDINVPDNLANTIQVLAPTFPIFSQLANSSSLTSEAKLFINQVLIPLSTLLPQVNAASTTANLIAPGPVSSA
eukprot:jgi/Astpho2/6762/fgenesh1_pg.00103_%23_1_t